MVVVASPPQVKHHHTRIRLGTPLTSAKSLKNINEKNSKTKTSLTHRRWATPIDVVDAIR